MLGEGRVLVDDALGGVAGVLDGFAVSAEGGQLEVAAALLALAEDGALAADLEVDLGQLEAVVGADEGVQAGVAAGSLLLVAGRAPALVTRKQWEASAPRPTRPRSWWSCAMPNRSASSTTMTVALGTSTPTSITVVATRTLVPPSRKRAMVASFSAAGSRPWSSPSESPDSSSASSRAWVSSAEATSSLSLSPMRGHTT